MRLEKRNVTVRTAVFDDKTYAQDGVLHINKSELESELEDPAFERVQIEIALPGTSCRIANVCNIVEPTVKLEEEQGTFPGAIGTMVKAGSGASLVLKGAAVVEVSEVFVQTGGILDMQGIGTEHTIFGKTVNIAVDPFPAKDVDEETYFHALNRASLKAAKYLAQKVWENQPQVDSVDVYDLDREITEDLPRVAYTFQIFSHAPLTDCVFYGDNCMASLPSIVHPNEILDGALLNRNYKQLLNSDPTYLLQNHPIIQELYRRHGVDIHFVGVVLTNTPSEITYKTRNAQHTAFLMKEILKADAVIITKEGGGHPQIDIQMQCDLCEKMGLKTGILISEFLSLTNVAEDQVIFNSPYADAMVSSGCCEMLHLDRVDRVIGSRKIADLSGRNFLDPYGELQIANRFLRGSMSQLGGTQYGTKRY